ncbi:hypothetical protein [Thermomonas alba]|uniref:hypothetical protein n=1 Tax=Thermomonas alba TaxID=2888525 RepID=UPI001F03BA20|nr:hypothetical protein [Thermomonas alba]
MTTAADVIAAINQRRLLRMGRPDGAGQFPAGWQGWFEALDPIDTSTARAHVEACVAGLAQRPLPPRGGGGLGAPFFHLLRRARPSDPREDRGLRIAAGVADLLLHIVLLVLLAWLMYLRFLALSQAPEDEQAVQVEFIGRGNAAAGGGALANAGAESAPAAAAPRARTSRVPEPPVASVATGDGGRPQLEQQALPSPPVLQALPDAPARQPPPTPASAAQELDVSNVPQPQPQALQLPPPRPSALRLPALQLRDVPPQAAVEELPNLPTPPVRMLQPAERPLPLRVPEPKTRVEEIEVFTPDTRAIARLRPLPTVDLPLREERLRSQVQALPLREGQASAAAPGGAASAQPGVGSAANGASPVRGAGGDARLPAGSGQAQAGTGAGARAAAEGGRGVGTVGAGAGPGLTPAPGGWPGAAKSDDWGASNRNVAGTGNGGRRGDGQSGLFNPDGSVRLPDTWSKNNRLDLDRAGTWLKRPGLEYRGTRFDKYWIPDGSLLQEWVRRGIKELSIPIPGTGLQLKCVVSLLQFGGSCYPVDPDANEQPSSGRPAPDIPFKPELQEDNGSVRPPTSPAGQR